MKPTSPAIQHRRHLTSIPRRRVGLQATMSQFQAGRLEDFSGGGNEPTQPSFRGISEGYFSKEARRHFASEAVFFALIFVTAAVPVVASLRSMSEFLHAIL